MCQLRKVPAATPKLCFGQSITLYWYMGDGQQSFAGHIMYFALAIAYTAIIRPYISYAAVGGLV